MVSIAEIPSVGGASDNDCKSCNPSGQCGNGLEKVYPTCAVRYGAMNYIGEFSYAPGMLFGCGQKVVVQSDRGTEVGQQVSLTCSGCSKSVSREQIKAYVQNSGPDFFRLHTGRILRVATPTDLTENEKQQSTAREMLRECGRLVEQLRLPMKLVTCEYLLGGERAVVYFTADMRVDFRELVHQLARVYYTRIEMRQVGARDEARLVADYEICGRECCCKNFLKTLRPVTMQMAKLQKANFDPSKVSGRCGRLRCCLRYEHEGYAELNQKLPRTGRRVLTAQGPATVVDRQVLTQLLLVQYDDGRQVTIPVEEISLPEPGSAAAERPPPASHPPGPRAARERPSRLPRGPGPTRPTAGDQPPQLEPPGGQAGDDRTSQADLREPVPDAPSADPPGPAGSGRESPRQPAAGAGAGAHSNRPPERRRSRRWRRRRRGQSGGPGGDAGGEPL